ncbi:MAG: metallophosphoesterase family protein, partial [Actinomycetota bacterium]
MIACGSDSTGLCRPRPIVLDMRIGVISDIHGNNVALDAVLADVAHSPVDSWVCLGDVVQGGVQPLEV